jgi:hypothetical protein
MSRVDDVELEQDLGEQLDLDFAARAAGIEAPQGTVPRVTGRTGTGRLGPLAQWWERVAPSSPGGPRRVEHRWVAGPVALAPPSRASVSVFGFEAPPGVAEAYAWGAAAADSAADSGTDLLLVSVADDVASTLGAHLLGLDPVDALGWPARAGVDDATWVAEVVALRDGLRRVRGEIEPGRQLAALGSPAMAAGVGLLLQAGVRRTPVLLDGAGAVVCAQLAYRVTRRVRGWWQVAQSNGSVLHEAALEKLLLDPLLRLEVYAEDGTAARLALAVLEAATAPAAPADAPPPPRKTSTRKAPAKKTTPRKAAAKTPAEPPAAKPPAAEPQEPAAPSPEATDADPDTA